jgi:leucyl/phenylalanyl-tRNA--protein transferase
LSSDLLLAAYAQGLFPMAHEDGELYWHDPDPRAILPLDRFHAPRSLERVVKSRRFQIRIDTAFEAVVRHCAASGPGREETWISDEIIDAYTRLHRKGFAHSVEAWYQGGLAGGLYGVALRGLFAGESMFSRKRDASKVALYHLIQGLRQGGFKLLDVQYITEHLRRFGSMEISRIEYRRRLVQAMAAAAQFQVPAADDG